MNGKLDRLARVVIEKQALVAARKTISRASEIGETEARDIAVMAIDELIDQCTATENRLRAEIKALSN